MIIQINSWAIFFVDFNSKLYKNQNSESNDITDGFRINLIQFWLIDH